MALYLFEEAHEQVKKNIHTTLFGVIEQTAVKTFFNEGANELLDEKMYKLADFQDVTQRLVRHLRKPSTITAPVTTLCKAASENIGRT